MLKQVGNIIIKIVILTIIFQMTVIPVSNAFFEDKFDRGDEFIEKGKDQTENDKDGPGVDQEKLDSTISEIYNALLALGVVISVIIGAALGIKLMVGSVEEQAKAKELLAPYVAGCIVVFGAFGIWKLMMTVLGSI